MINNPARYSFISTDSTLGEASFKPFLPLTLNYKEKSQSVIGLLDTGAMVNVLHYQLGVEYCSDYCVYILFLKKVTL
jgi:hypothetical protein